MSGSPLSVKFPTVAQRSGASHLHMCMVGGTLRHLDLAPSIYTLLLYLSIVAIKIMSLVLKMVVPLTDGIIKWIWSCILAGSGVR